VPYETEADAEAVRATLAVDNELQPDKVVKRLKVEGTDLVAYVHPSLVLTHTDSRSDRATRLTVPLFFDLTLTANSTHPSPVQHSEFFATEPRLLRAAVAAFLDLLKLSTRTIETFGHVPVA
jgi:hypothetical protein